MASHDHTQRPTPGTIAITLMGWLELIASLTLFLMDLTIVAIVFAIASVLLTLVSSLIRQPSWAVQRRQPEAASPTNWAAIFRTLFLISLVLAVASLGGGVFMLALGEELSAVLMALWALSLGMQALRLWPRK